MPLMFPFLDCMRVNAFVIMKAFDEKLKHKDFIKDWIKGPLARAAAASLQVRRAARHRGNDDEDLPPSSPNKRRRISHNGPMLPDCRFNGSPEQHTHVTDKSLRGNSAPNLHVLRLHGCHGQTNQIQGCPSQEDSQTVFLLQGLPM